MMEDTKSFHLVQRFSQINNTDEIDCMSNSMDDSVWYIFETGNSDGDKPFAVNWNLMCDYDSRITKGLLRWKFAKGEKSSGKIYANEKTLKNTITYCKSFLDCRRELYTDTSIDELSIEELKKIIRRINPGPYKYESLLRGLRVAYDEGYCTHGVSVDLPKDLSRYLYRDKFENEKLYKTWLKGGSWGNLPIATGMVYLSDCIEIIEGDHNIFLVEFFRIQKSINTVPLKYLFCNHRDALVYRDIYSEPDFICLSENCKSGLVELSNLFLRYGYTKVNRLNKKTLRRMAITTFDAALITCLMLTGVRLSEIASIRKKDIKDDGKGNYSFISKIEKTHSGMPITRTMSGVAYEAMKMVVEISYRDNVDDPVFLQTFTSGYYEDIDKISTVTITKDSLGKRVSDLYSKWISIQSKGVKEYSPLNSSSPSLRHLFASVAIRRFDGRVFDNIRRHYGHAYKNRYTKSYVETKYDQDYQYAAEREYINEIIIDIASGEEEFYGPVAMQIKKRIDEDHRFLSLNEFYEAVGDLSEEFERIVPHEFGYCVPRTKEIAKAQCKDKDTGEAKIWEESSIKNCSKCVHRLTHRTQAENIVRIAISHQNFVDNSPVKAISDLSKKIVKQCDSILSEMSYVSEK